LVKLRKGIPLATGPKHTIRLEVTDEALTVHTGLSLFYAMAEALDFSGTLIRSIIQDGAMPPRLIFRPEFFDLTASRINLGWD
jgi:hypothetical protein